MNIHTVIYNSNDKINHKFNSFLFNNVIYWNHEKIITFINDYYPKYLIFYKKLILNKSKENFIKYLIISKFGGIFININLFKILNDKCILFIENQILEKNDIIFWEEKEKKNITLEIFDIDKIYNDDIFIIKKPNNNFVNWLIKQYEIDFIPTNEFENKIKFGNIFLSRKINEFIENYSSRSIFDNLFINFLSNKKKNKIDINYENQVDVINIITEFNFDDSYKSITYPNIPELSNPETKLNSLDFYYNLKNKIENILIYIFFQYKNWFYIMIMITFIVSINFIIKKSIIDNFNKTIKSYQIDSKIFYNPKKFKLFRELYKNWKNIQKEAIEVIKNAPILDMVISINDFNNYNINKSNLNKYGWIKTYKYNSNINNNKKLNYIEWLNYGLISDGKEFNENVKHCPFTVNLLRKIYLQTNSKLDSSNINIDINMCGFSLMQSNIILESYPNNINSLNNSLTLYIYLIVPKPEKSCKLIVKNDDIGDFVQIIESNGKIIIFNENVEHYTYNQSNMDKIIFYVNFNVN